MISKIVLFVVKQFLILVALGVLALIVLRTVQEKKGPALKLWHTTELSNDFYAGRPDVPDFQAYLALENRLFKELHESVESSLPVEDRTSLNRYFPMSRSSPSAQPHDWNRSYVSIPPNPKGVVVLLHGLTDSPYTMHALAILFQRLGYAVFLPRLPGHGTIPGALRFTRWPDWTAAVDLTCRAAAKAVGPNKPLILCGYSNGGLLAVHYVLSQLNKGSTGVIPQRLILLAPAIGITRFAAFASYYRILTVFSYFKKVQWAEVEPEYDPFKYNSFPKMAGAQTYRLTRLVNRELESLDTAHGFDRFPPVLTFTSVVDSTVLTPALVHRFYSKLKGNHNELVLYDLNRNEAASEFIKDAQDQFLSELKSSGPTAYALTILTNDSANTLRVKASRRRSGSNQWVDEPLALEWPHGVYSLSHLAIPNAPNDPLYGRNTSSDPKNRLALGLLEPRGETNVLNVSPAQFLRLRYNPFYDDMEKRITECVGTDGRSPEKTDHR